MKQFEVNAYITLKLEPFGTIIYINGKKFDQCKFLLLNIPVESVSSFDEIRSIDEAGDELDKLLEAGEGGETLIPPEVEFWAHCSNLQVWAENGYDTQLLHSNLAFPLLKRLTDIGDPMAKRVFKEEIAKRLSSGYPSVVSFLIEEKFIDYLDHHELLFSLLVHQEAEVIRELEQLSNIPFEKSIQFEILYDFEEYKVNSILIRNKHVIRLDMYKVNLRQFPEIVLQLSYLKELFFRKLRLKLISDNIGILESLEWVDLSKNILERLPKSFGNLQRLKQLNLKGNRLFYLSQALGGLKNLKELNINDNNIYSFPDSFAGL